jgi:hypothetical protein
MVTRSRLADHYLACGEKARWKFIPREKNRRRAQAHGRREQVFGQ